MEIGYCTVETLLYNKRLKKTNFTVSQIHYILESLAKTLEIMHGKQLFHLDLKLENIALDLNLT